ETTTAPAEKTSDIMRGDLVDAGGKILMYSNRDESGTGKEIRMTNDANKVAFANVLNEMSEGLDLTYDKLLRTENPSPLDVKMGQSVQLTFDSAKQVAIYDYMAGQNLIGSVVVMRTDGSLMAQVNYPSYDPDLYYGSDTDEDLAWGNYGNKAFQNAEPGSCFKIMSEVISDKHGVTSLYDEGTWEFDGVSIVNWDHEDTWKYPVYERSLYSAFVNSSNIYFAKAFDQIGKDDVLADLDSIFHFCSDIECDFGTLHNNVEIYCDDDLRRTAFGQSYVLTCPLYLAALGREAVFGDMVTPFTIANIVDTNDFSKVLKSGSAPNQVICSIPAEYRQNLLSGMSGVAANIGLAVPAGYEFYAKTGTAETWKGDFLYITGVLKNPNDDGSSTWSDYTDYDGSYIIVMQVQNPEHFGYSFASDSVALYQGLVNAVVG
ncbi:MAG: penicillin-binding transpeptidase domain-containing protein, partial [Ruminococcus sp.]|nr:penicillin-binding transpeptidase domain-containing protein [Ruminococcus sp.]